MEPPASLDQIHEVLQKKEFKVKKCTQIMLMPPELKRSMNLFTEKLLSWWLPLHLEWESTNQTSDSLFT